VLVNVNIEPMSKGTSRENGFKIERIDSLMRMIYCMNIHAFHYHTMCKLVLMFMPSRSRGF